MSPIEASKGWTITMRTYWSHLRKKNTPVSLSIRKNDKLFLVSLSADFSWKNFEIFIEYLKDFKEQRAIFPNRPKWTMAGLKIKTKTNDYDGF